MPPAPVYTADRFRPLHGELMRLLGGLPDDDWHRPTVAGPWTVKDVVAHMLDGQLRRLSFQRDGHPMPLPTAPLQSRDDLVAFLDALNAEWVGAFRRVGPAPLLALLQVVGPMLASFFESLDPHAPAFFAVDWAGESASENWMDVGRDYTELWHHQAQVRLALEAEPLIDEVWMAPLYQLAVRALPLSLARAEARSGSTVVVEVQGPGAGSWTLRAEGGSWAFVAERPARPDARVRMDGATAWRVFFNAVAVDAAADLVYAEGDPSLVNRVLRTRSVMVADR